MIGIPLHDKMVFILTQGPGCHDCNLSRLQHPGTEVPFPEPRGMADSTPTEMELSPIDCFPVSCLYGRPAIKDPQGIVSGIWKRVHNAAIHPKFNAVYLTRYDLDISYICINLADVMACCLAAPSCYLNQSSLLNSATWSPCLRLRNSIHLALFYKTFSYQNQSLIKIWCCVITVKFQTCINCTLFAIHIYRYRPYYVCPLMVSLHHSSWCPDIHWKMSWSEKLIKIILKNGKTKSDA